MKEYIFSVMCAGITAGIAGLFFEGSNVGKFIKLALSLCFIASLIPGAKKLVGEIDVLKNDISVISSFDFEQASQNYTDYVLSEAKNRLSDELKKTIFEKTGIMPASVDIQFNVTESEAEIAVDIASVTVISDSLEAVPGIYDYISDLTGVVPIFEKEKEK